jgi:membrane-associated phospholipid phosphatase
VDDTSADQVSAEVAGEAPAPPRRLATRPYSRLISGVLLLILIVLTINVLVHGPLTGLDERIRAAVLARADSPAWRWLSDTPQRPAPLLTDLGMYVLAVPILAAVGVALAIRRHTLRPLLIAVTGVVLLLGTVIPAKIIIGRPGPGLPAVVPGQLGVFPSGHTSTACICFSLAVLMLVAGQPTRTRYLALAGLALLWLGVGAALI